MGWREQPTRGVEGLRKGLWLGPKNSKFGPPGKLKESVPPRGKPHHKGSSPRCHSPHFRQQGQLEMSPVYRQEGVKKWWSFRYPIPEQHGMWIQVSVATSQRPAADNDQSLLQQAVYTLWQYLPLLDPYLFPIGFSPWILFLLVFYHVIIKFNVFVAKINF